MFSKFIVGIVTFLLTAFVLANTYEVIFNEDIPFANAIAPMNTKKIIDRTIDYYSDAGEKTFTSKTGALGELDYMYLPSIDARVFIARERLIDDTWYYRPNNIHYIPLNYDAFDDIGDYLFYTTKSFRSISAPQDLEIGEEVAVTNTRGKTTSFSIVDKQILPYDETYVVSDTGLRQIIIIVEDTDNDVYYLFVAR